MKREFSTTPLVAGPSKVRKIKTLAAIVDISSGNDITTDIPSVFPEVTIFSPLNRRKKGKNKAVEPVKE